jgi:hypothetical protein
MTPVTELSDRATVLILQELAEDLTRPAEITTPEEAWLAISAVLAAGGHDDAIARPESADEALAAARRLLDHVAADGDVAPVVEPLIEDPPADEQLAVETVVVTVVVVAAAIAFLQTKISFKVQRDEKGTRVDFEVLKKSTSDSVLHKLIDVLADVFRSGQQ